MVFSKSLLSAETFERVCLKAREINSKEKCLFKMYVLCGHSGARIHIQGEEPLRDQGGGLPGVPRAPGCGLQARQRPVLGGEGSQSNYTCRPLPGWEEGRAVERSCRKRKGRGTQKDLLGGVQTEIPQQAS